jgi:hypothetical protein
MPCGAFRRLHSHMTNRDVLIIRFPSRCNGGQETYFNSIGAYTASSSNLSGVAVTPQLSKVESIYATGTLGAAETVIATMPSSTARLPVRPTGLTDTPCDGAIVSSRPPTSSATSYSVDKGTTPGGEIDTTRGIQRHRHTQVVRGRTYQNLAS